MELDKYNLFNLYDSTMSEIMMESYRQHVIEERDHQFDVPTKAKPIEIRQALREPYSRIIMSIEYNEINKHE